MLDLHEAVGKRYRIAGELGRGGMGVVYLAHENARDRPVALKVLRPELAADPQKRKRFLKEARAAARLRHPNIVRIHAVEEAGEFAYFTMDYVDGETLGQRVRAGGALTPGEASRMLRAVAGALGYAHRRGVIHRDVKPDNIMIEHGNGRAVVMDVGIAHGEWEREIDPEGYLSRTAPFLSPEQQRGGTADTRSDVYALGLTAHFAVAGHLPVEGNSVDWSAFLAWAPDRQPELPLDLRVFASRLRAHAESTDASPALALLAMIALAGAVEAGDALPAAIAGGILFLMVAVGLWTVLGSTRRLLVKGYTRADMIQATTVDLEREAGLRLTAYGTVATWVVRAARQVAYAALGLAGVGAALSLVEGLPVAVSEGVTIVGVVVAAAAAWSGYAYARPRLDRPGELLLRFWRSRAGEWAVRLAGMGLKVRGELARSRREAEALAWSRIERIREWLQWSQAFEFRGRQEPMPIGWGVRRRLEGHFIELRALLDRLAFVRSGESRERVTADIEAVRRIGEEVDRLLEGRSARQ